MPIPKERERSGLEGEGEGKGQGFLRLLEGAFLALLVIRSTTEAFSGLGVVLGPWVVNPSVVAVLLMDGVGALYLAGLWRRGLWELDRLGILFLAWVLSLGVWVYIAAATWGLPGLTGVREWIRLLSLVMVYLVARAVAERRGPSSVIYACLLALPIPLAVTYGQAFLAPEARAAGVMVHPNNLAAFLVVMIALTLWKLGQPSLRGTTRILWGGLLLLELGALIPPVSSNGWLMFGIFLAVFALFSPGWRWKAAGGVAGLVFLALFAVLFLQSGRLQQEVWQNLNDLGLPTPGEETLREGTLAFRLKMWQGLVDVWRERPWTGFGLEAVPWLNPVVGKAAHNDYVRYLVEGGLIGLALFVLFLAFVGGELFRRWKRASTPEARRTMAIALGLFAAWAFGSVGDNVVGITVFHVYLWSSLAALSVAAGFRNPAAAWDAPREREWTPKGAESFPPPPPLPPPSFRERLAAWGERWGVAVRSRPRGEVSLLCRSCLTSSWTSGALLCRRCFRPLLHPGGLFAFGVLTLSAVGLIGFYLWNKGAEVETFWVAWLLGVSFLALLLRNESRGFGFALLTAFFIGAIAVNRLYHPPALEAIFAEEIAFVGLLGLALGGLLEVWWTVSRSLPVGFALLALLSWGLGVGVPSLGSGLGLELELEELVRLGRIVSGSLADLPAPASILGSRLPLLAGASPAVAVSAGLGALAGLSLALVGFVRIGRALALRRASGRSPGAALLEAPIAVVEALGDLLSVGGRWGRVYAVPIAALYGLAGAVDLGVQQISAFLYGDPYGFVRALGGFFGAFAALIFFLWGATQRGVRVLLVDVGLAFLGLLLLVQLSAWLASGVLWGTAQILPLFPETQRFAPLLPPRPLGQYTGYSLGVLTGALLALGLESLRRRLRLR